VRAARPDKFNPLPTDTTDQPDLPGLRTCEEQVGAQEFVSAQRPEAEAAVADSATRYALVGSLGSFSAVHTDPVRSRRSGRLAEPGVEPPTKTAEREAAR
jgi:hypothetical protein